MLMIERQELIRGKATICIPNYKTLNFTQLCLRSIRKFTKYPYEVIVVDNNSADESLEYLRSVAWIRLIERNSAGAEIKGSVAEGSALDIGLKECKTEFYIAMHSDTFVQRENWLTNLMSYFGDDDRVACVGSGKIENKSKFQVILKDATDLKALKRKLLKDPERLGRFRYHNRTICCIYRTDVLKNENLSFMPQPERGLTAGRGLYFALVDGGHKCVELRPSIMAKYILHLNHATQAVNPNEFTLRKKTTNKCTKIINKVMASAMTENLLADTSLDM